MTATTGETTGAIGGPGCSADHGSRMSDIERQPVAIEPRWPVVLVVLGFVVITITLRILEPQRESFGPRWLVPAIEIAMLAALVAADPARVSAGHRWLRRTAIGLVFALALTAMMSTLLLLDALIGGGKLAGSPSSLLASGALIWLGNLLVFSLIYWQFDTGGPLARYRHERVYPDFAFPQQLNPELAPPDWRPQYIDYLILGLTTSTALSPTDVLPMARWAKLAMGLQSLVSLLVIALVIARAVNAF